MDTLTVYFYLVMIMILTHHMGHCFTWLRQGSIGNDTIHFGIFDMRLNWFEARGTCRQYSYDDLDDGDLSSDYHQAIAQKLTEDLSHLSPFTFWTYFHCPNSTTKDWYQTGCDVTDRVSVTCTPNEQCVSIEYSEVGEDTIWYHQTENCSRKLPFICKKHLEKNTSRLANSLDQDETSSFNGENGPATFRTCGICKIVQWPSTVTKSSSQQESRDNCMQLCEFDCVAYEYDINLNTCHVFTVVENKALVDLQIYFSINSIRVGIKKGVNVTYVPTIEPLISPVLHTFSCPAQPTTTPLMSTTSLTVTTTSSTVTSQTSTATPTTSTNSESTSTSTPVQSSPMSSTSELPSIVNVIGFTNPYADVDVHVFMTPATWFEAKAVCESEEQFGSLYNYDNETLTTKVSTILESNGVDPNSTFWTSIYRQGLSKTIWYDGSWSGPDCDVVDDVIGDNGGQCVTIAFENPSGNPSMFSRNCTDRLPFACVKTKDIEFVKYSGYGKYSVDSTSTFLLSLSGVPVSDCNATCQSAVSCVGFTYIDDGLGKLLCFMVNVHGGISYLEYSLKRYGDIYTHNVKAGSKGLLYPASAGFSFELNVPNDVPACNTSNETTITPLSSNTGSVTSLSASSSSTHPSPVPSTTSSSTLLYTSSSLATPSTPISNSCVCPATSNVCIIEYALDHLSLESVLRGLIANLTIGRKSTSSYRRSLISAEDARSSSAVIGTGAIIFLSLCLSVIVLPDVIQLTLGVKRLMSPGKAYMQYNTTTQRD